MSFETLEKKRRRRRKILVVRFIDVIIMLVKRSHSCVIRRSSCRTSSTIRFLHFTIWDTEIDTHNVSCHKEEEKNIRNKKERRNQAICAYIPKQMCQYTFTCHNSKFTLYHRSNEKNENKLSLAIRTQSSFLFSYMWNFFRCVFASFHLFCLEKDVVDVIVFFFGMSVLMTFDLIKFVRHRFSATAISDDQDHNWLSSSVDSIFSLSLSYSHVCL